MKIGLIGAGRWGKRYIETLGRMPGETLSCLASSNPESAALVPPGCRVTPRWRGLLEGQGRPDGIIVATPPGTHLEIAAAIIQAGIPVLVEKPLTLSLPEAEELAKEAGSRRVLAMVGHTHLYSAAFRELKRRGQALGRLKEIRSAGGAWGPFRPDTPPLWDWAPHDISMALELEGSCPVSVEASRTARIEQPPGTGEAVSITLRFASGAAAGINISNVQKQKQRLFEAVYEGGSLTYDDLAPEKLVYRSSPGAAPEPVALEGSMPLTNLVAEFCRAIGEGRRSDPSLQLGLQVVKVLSACQKAIDAAA